MRDHAAGAELPPAVRGDHDLEPRRRRRARRLPVAGLGDHPQPAADRPRRRRPATAMAGVHAAGRRHHRPRRSPAADGRRERGPCGVHRAGGGRRALARQRSCRGPTSSSGHRHRVVAVPVVIRGDAVARDGEVLYDNSAQTFMPRIVGDDQLEKANGRMWASETSPTSSSARRSGAAARRRVRAAVLGRRRRRSPCRPGWCSRSSPSGGAGGDRRRVERRPWKDELPRAFAGSGATNCSARWRSSSGALNGLGRSRSRPSRAVRARRSCGTSTAEFAVLTMAGAVGGIVGGWTGVVDRQADRLGAVVVGHAVARRRGHLA